MVHVLVKNILEALVLVSAWSRSLFSLIPKTRISKFILKCKMTKLFMVTVFKAIFKTDHVSQSK